MDLISIIIISFVLFAMILTPPFIKRAYRRRQHEKILREYRDSCEQYNEISLKQEVAPLNNVISLEEYRERRI